VDRVYIDPASLGRVLAWVDVAQTRPGAPAAAHLYNGRPLSRDEVLAQLRASRAAIRLEAGQIEAAERDARAALAVAPDLPEGLVNLAAVELRRKNAEAAQELLGRAQRLIPQNGVVLFNLGLAAAARGDPREAMAHYRAALEADPRMAKARANLEALEKGGVAGKP
jgi:type IV pilus assembly protein PilF